MKLDENLPAPSNSRLGSPIWGISIFNVSLDDVTIVGDISKNNAARLQMILDNKFEVSTIKLATDLVKCKIFQSAYFEYDKLQGVSRKRRNARIEFNPNSLQKEELEWINNNILSLMADKSFTRLDLAFDFENDISDYYAIFERGLMTNVIQGPNGEVQTRYYGSRSSDRFIRMYNKKIERLEKNDEVVDRENWWRIEFELKRSACENIDNCLRGMKLVYPLWQNIENANEKLKVYALLHNSEFWKDLSKNQRTKYKKIIADLSDIDVVNYMEEAYRNHRKEIHMQLEKWLS